MTQIHCLHDLIDHLARNGAVIVLSPFNSAEVDPSVDLGELQLVEWPVKQFAFGTGAGVTTWTKVDPTTSVVVPTETEWTVDSDRATFGEDEPGQGIGSALSSPD